MPPAPVIKLDITSVQVTDCKIATRDLLLANGFPDTDETWALACAVAHLAYTYGPTANVKIHIEYTPSHYQLTVDLI